MEEDRTETKRIEDLNTKELKRLIERNDGRTPVESTEGMRGMKKISRRTGYLMTFMKRNTEIGAEEEGHKEDLSGRKSWTVGHSGKT